MHGKRVDARAAIGWTLAAAAVLAGCETQTVEGAHPVGPEVVAAVEAEPGLVSPNQHEVAKAIDSPHLVWRRGIQVHTRVQR